MSYIMNAVIDAPCIASTSTPVLYTVCTSTEIMISSPSIVCVMAVYSTGNGWQSGITSLVFFTASNPAARENSNTSPLGTFFCWIAAIVALCETVTVAVAIALRSVSYLWVMLTISVVFLPLIGVVFKQFPAPDG